MNMGYPQRRGLLAAALASRSEISAAHDPLLGAALEKNRMSLDSPRQARFSFSGEGRSRTTAMNNPLPANLRGRETGSGRVSGKGFAKAGKKLQARRSCRRQ